MIASKEAAGRPKDLRALPELLRLAGQARRAVNFPQPPQAALGKPPVAPTAAERIAAVRRQAAQQRDGGEGVER